jgi:hypothetical protein
MTKLKSFKEYVSTYKDRYGGHGEEIKESVKRW